MKDKIIGVVLILILFSPVIGLLVYEFGMKDICLGASKVVKYEGYTGTRYATYHVYKLENGLRVESQWVYSDGEYYCFKTKKIWK